MSEALIGAMIGAIAALAGTALSSFLEGRRRDRERLIARREALRAQRAEDYRQFIDDVLLTARELAKAGLTEPGSAARSEASRLVNERITGGTLRLQLIAEPETLQLARDLRTQVNRYRTIVDGGRASGSDEWIEISEKHYLPAREAFQQAARAEVIGAAG